MNRLERDCVMDARRVEVLAELFAAVLVDDPPTQKDWDYWAECESRDAWYGEDGE